MPQSTRGLVLSAALDWTRPRGHLMFHQSGCASAGVRFRQPGERGLHPVVAERCEVPVRDRSGVAVRLMPKERGASRSCWGGVAAMTTSPDPLPRYARRIQGLIPKDPQLQELMPDRPCWRRSAAGQSLEQVIATALDGTPGVRRWASGATRSCSIRRRDATPAVPASLRDDHVLRAAQPGKDLANAWRHHERARVDAWRLRVHPRVHRDRLRDRRPRMRVRPGGQRPAADHARGRRSGRDLHRHGAHGGRGDGGGPRAGGPVRGQPRVHPQHHRHGLRRTRRRRP